MLKSTVLLHSGLPPGLLLGVADVATMPVPVAVGLMAVLVIAILVGSGRHHRGAMVSVAIAGAVLATLFCTSGGSSS